MRKMLGNNDSEAFWVLTSVGIDGLWLIGGLHIGGFGLEVGIGFLQIFGVRVQRERRSEDALVADGCGNIHFLTVQARMFLVSEHIAGEVLGVFDGSADQTVVT